MINLALLSDSQDEYGTAFSDVRELRVRLATDSVAYFKEGDNGIHGILFELSIVTV